MAETDRLILEAAAGVRVLAEDELQHILAYVVQAGFDPATRERVRGRLAGVVWRAHVLRGHDRLPPVETHYLWHVVGREEWPAGTTIVQYVESIGRAILDPMSGVFTSQYQGAWQLGIAGGTSGIRGPRGGDWLLVEYRIAMGHWVTAYQPKDDVRTALMRNPRRSDVRWLRRPRLRP